MSALSEAMSGMMSSPGSDVIHLSIGGREFSTTRSTLKACGYLDALLRGPWEAKKDDSGRVFVDRDGDDFGLVLSFCRGCLKRSTLDRMDLMSRANLIEEAEFYQVPGLIECAVLPPVGATVRYSYRHRVGDFSSASQHVLCQGRVVAYTHATRTWQVEVASEGVIHQQHTTPAVKPLAERRMDAFSWPPRDYDCSARCLTMPWEYQSTSEGHRLAPFTRFECGWQWLSTWGHWVDAEAAPKDPEQAAANDPFWNRAIPAAPLDEPTFEELAALRAASSPPPQVRFFPAGAGVGAI